jgi:hypothetical protein
MALTLTVYFTPAGSARIVCMDPAARRRMLRLQGSVANGGKKYFCEQGNTVAM